MQNELSIVEGRECVRANRRAYASQPDRVVFVSFPRSGSNWACLLLSEMMRAASEDGQSVGLTGRKGFQICPLDSPDLHLESFFARGDFSGIVKTHQLSANAATSVIYMFRDARDVLGSFRNWHRETDPGQHRNQWSDFLYVRRNLRLLLHQWWKAVFFGLRHPARFLAFSYESLLAHPVGQLRRLATFLEINLSDAVLRDIYDRCTISKMQHSHPGLVYRSGVARKGRGDFGPALRVFIWFFSFVPQHLLSIASMRNPAAHRTH